MKRKKLRLHRETLLALGGDQLAQAGGGANTHEFNTGCACTIGCGGTGGGGTAGCTGGGSAVSCTCINPLSYCVGR